MPVTHRVIEYACAVVKNGKPEREYEQLLSIPSNDIPTVVQVLTQIRPVDLSGKPTFKDIHETIEGMLAPDAILVGQNIQFDLKMLKGEGWNLTERPWIDTAMLASIVYPELKSYSLGFMSEVLGLTHTPKHRALGDVRATLQLFGLCCERLESLPEKELGGLKSLAERGPESYRRLFASLLSTSKKKRPDWLSLRKHALPEANDLSIPASPLPEGEIPSVQIVEETLSPATLQSVVAGATKRTVVAVKNLDAVLRRLELPESIVVLPAAEMILSKEAAETFLLQKTFTADELSLAMKLVLYAPELKIDLPIHGDEYAVWTAKLAAGNESPEYLARRKKLGKVTVVTSHHELISIANSEDTKSLKGTPVIIDDASMLEDTATQALGWTCFVPTLRAMATGSEHLTKCVDLIELWTEKTRGGNDLRYLAPSDLGSPESESIRSVVEPLLKTDLPAGARHALMDLLKILDPQNLDGRIPWIECFQDGNKSIKSVPEKIGEELAAKLYSLCPTTLLMPKSLAKECGAIVPQNTETISASLSPLPPCDLTVTLPIGVSTDQLLQSATGKTVLLVGSKRTIEDLYVKHFEKLEAVGVTLLCQGFAGGQSRMQAEFTQAPEPAVLVTTPWTYETMELTKGMVKSLILQVLPFDHPSHAVFSRRALRYQDPFSEYSLPRLKHRLFRLIRAFARHAKKDASVLILDDRLRTKQYGKNVAQYLLGLGNAKGEKKTAEQMSLL